MNLEEMRKELKMSKQRMSTSVRKLQGNGMVKRIFQRGTRKHTYSAEKDFFRSFMSFYCQMWEREVKLNLKAIKEAEADLKEIIDDEKVRRDLWNEGQCQYALV